MDISQFKTQKSLRDYVRSKLAEIGECDSIKKKHPKYWNGFIELFTRHYAYPEKFNGLVDIRIKYNPVFKNQLEVQIVKNNGETDDVSVLKNCISGKPKDKLTIAMRNSISPQIFEFKKNHTQVCVLCKSTKNIHIDHYEPQFVELKRDFIATWKSNIPTDFSQNQINSKVFHIQDNKFEDEWNKYHKQNAVLRVLCSDCNCGRSKVRPK
jgi:hypothetical protein